MLAIGYIAFSMLGVAAMAVLLSTLSDSPLAASLGALAFLIGSSLLLTIDAARALQPYLPTRYWLSFVDLFRDPILWRNLERGRRPAGGVRRRAARRRLGQLRDQGHHELSRRQSALPSCCGRPGARARR